jgi:hypothetical protein
MTIKCIEGFEGGIRGPFVTAGGTADVQTVTKRSGTYSLQTNPTTTNTGFWLLYGLATTGGIDTTNGFNVADLYVGFYFRIATLPAANNEEIFRHTNVNSSTSIQYRIGSTGVITAYSGPGALVATGTTVLSTGVWYRIDIRCSGGAAGNYEIKINGVSELSGAVAQTASNILRFALGKTVNQNGNSVDFFYDDVVADDAAYPVDAPILVMAVNADGSTQQWTSGTNASNYLEVDEIPTDFGVTYVKCGTGGNQVSLFGLQSCAVAGVSGTINAAIMTAIIREDITVASDNRLRVRSGGNNYDSTTFDHTTSYFTRGALHTVDPATGVAWTIAGLDAVEIGSIEVAAVSMRMNSVFMQVLFSDSAPSGPPSSTDAAGAFGLRLGLGLSTQPLT